MQNQSPHRRISLGAITGFIALTLTTGGAIAWWNWTRNAPPPTTIEHPQSPKPAQTPVASAPANTQNQSGSASIPIEKTLQVYWLKPSGSAIELVPTPLKFSATENSDQLVKAALAQLLAGPTKATSTTTIPHGTRLRSLSIQTDGIHLDLSQRFTSGGGSASMTGRVAQVLYTATSLNPDMPVWLSVEGKPLETLGGEGLMLDRPLTRRSFKENFSL